LHKEELARERAALTARQDALRQEIAGRLHESENAARQAGMNLKRQYEDHQQRRQSLRQDAQWLAIQRQTTEERITQQRTLRPSYMDYANEWIDFTAK
jgi:FKBP-type peptidyl-prolyl cis-trans isomerase (trigger factor)